MTSVPNDSPCQCDYVPPMLVGFGIGFLSGAISTLWFMFS